MGRRFSYLARLFLTDQAAFKAEASEPVLMWEAPLESPETTPWKNTAASTDAKRPLGDEPLILQVKGRIGVERAFASAITLGRVVTNDIIVDDTSVSRLHAYFQKEGEKWVLVDAKSKNGTWVNRVKLGSGARVAISNYARLRFGSVEMMFLLPEGITEVVRRALGK